jgi:hypothetical protein
MALKAVPNTVKTRKRLKKVKKKFFLIRDISISPCEIIPCILESPNFHNVRRSSSLMRGTYTSIDRGRGHSTTKITRWEVD